MGLLFTFHHQFDLILPHKIVNALVPICLPGYLENLLKIETHKVTI